MTNHPIVMVHKISFLSEKIMDYLLKKEMNLSSSQYAVLLFCDLFPNISQQQIAEMRNCTEASISRTIKLMMKKGFLQRDNALGDKRKKELLLTSNGKILLEKSKKIVGKEFGSFCSVLSEKEKKETSHIFEKIWKKVSLRAEHLDIIKCHHHLKHKK